MHYAFEVTCPTLELEEYVSMHTFQGKSKRCSSCSSVCIQFQSLMWKNKTSSFSCMTLRDQNVAYVMPGKINFTRHFVVSLLFVLPFQHNKVLLLHCDLYKTSNTLPWNITTPRVTFFFVHKAQIVFGTIFFSMCLRGFENFDFEIWRRLDLSTFLIYIVWHHAIHHWGLNHARLTTVWLPIMLHLCEGIYWQVVCWNIFRLLLKKCLRIQGYLRY